MCPFKVSRNGSSVRESRTYIFPPRRLFGVTGYTVVLGYFSVSFGRTAPPAVAGWTK
jgi:hypothetical protein